MLNRKALAIGLLLSDFPSLVNCFKSIVRPNFEVMQQAMDKFGQGFDWANHEVHTEDGYILNMFRLVKGDGSRNPIEGEPILIMHGMSSNGSRFINRQYDSMDGLAISLAKAGYDVWLGNNRGTIFSNEHEKLDWAVDEEEYWDFSFPELGMFDLPAMVETVVEETNGRKVRYIGTSLGTTQMFYALQANRTK